jgi:C-terminal processing protease CtpA/Prc
MLARVLVFLPLSSAWLKAVHPNDFAALGAVRRRALISLVALAAIFAIGSWPSAGTQHGQGERAASSEPAPTPKVSRNLEERESPPRQQRSRPVEPSAELAPTAIEGAASPSRRVAGAETLAALRTPIRLYGTAKVSAVYEVYDFLGVRLEEIEPGSFWEILGVKEGDVVVEVHGEPLDDPSVGVALIKSLSQDSEVKIRVRGADGSQRYLQFTAPE